MGWKSALLGIGQIAAGGIATAMGGGAGLPLIMGGVSTLSGGLAADASQKAADTQVAAADRGMAQQAQTAQQSLDINRQIAGDTAGLQKQLYEQQRADLAPYMALGTGATGNLGQLVGLPPGSGTNQASVIPQPMADSAPSGQGMKQPIADPQSRAAMSTQSGYNIGGMVRGMVTLRGPDGSTRILPSNHPQIQQLVQQGAEVVH